MKDALEFLGACLFMLIGVTFLVFMSHFLWEAFR